MRSALLTALSMALVACSGEVLDIRRSSTGGTGGAAVTSTTSTTTTEGLVTKSGYAGPSCWDTAECETPGALCIYACDGGYDAFGTCVVPPASCPSECGYVCGCNGETYCNACDATAHGTTVVSDGPCPVSWRAINLFTDVPRFAMLKVDASRNLCVRMVLMGGLGAKIELGGTGQLAITASHDMADCAIQAGGWPPPAAAESVEASSAVGNVQVSSDGAGGCLAWSDAYAMFPPVSGDWVSADEELVPPKPIPIEGGCP
jgi:hypothetical protein